MATTQALMTKFASEVNLAAVGHLEKSHHQIRASLYQFRTFDDLDDLHRLLHDKVDSVKGRKAVDGTEG